MSNLDSFVEIAPYINIMTSYDLGISVCNTEECICYYPCRRINHGIKIGDALKPGTAIYRAITENKRIVGTVGAEVYGFPYVAVAFPVLENNNVVGGVCTFEDVGRQKELSDSAQILHSAFQEMNGILETVDSMISNMKQNFDRLDNLAVIMSEDIKNSQTIVETVAKTAKQSNILGINAGIEAARSGEAGSGFAVVAKEITRLSDDNKRFAVETQQLLDKVFKSSDEVSLGINELNKLSEDLIKQSEMLNEIKEKILSRAEAIAGLATMD